MRIPNKFNGYMSDGRRLYPDPATSAIMAKALATAGTASTAAAVPVATTLATAAAPIATTAATNLGTTAALEASKQGIVKAGADVMAQEAAKQAVAQGAQQAGAETLKTGIMQGADDVAAMGIKDVAALNPPVTPPTGVMNSAGELTSSYAPNIAPPPGPTPPVAPQASPYELAMQPKPAGNNPIAENMLNKASEPVNLPDTAYQQTYEGGLKNQAGDMGFKADASQLPVKTPPSAFDRGVAAAQKFAGDVGQFSKDHPYITTAGIMAAQNLSQPSYNQPAKKSYKGSGGGGGGGDFKYNAGETSEYTPIFEPTPYAREGGLMGYAVGGPVEQMSAQNAIGSNSMYPQSQMQTPMYSNPMVQRPIPTNVVSSGIDAPVNSYTGEARFADGGGVTGSGNLNLNVPLNFGGPGIGGNTANGYSAVGSGSGSGQNASLSTATGAPSQTAQQPMAAPGYTPAPLQQVDSSAAAPAASAPVNRGNAFIPKMEFKGGATLMGSGSVGGRYTVGDEAADAWVRSQAQSKNINQRQSNQAQFQDLYNQYYRGYASGGKVSAFEKMMKEEEARKKQADAQARSDMEEGKSIASRGVKPYSRTQSTNTPYAAAIKELQAMGKKYGIKTAAPAKTNVDLMGDQDQIEYAANGGIMHGLGGYSDGGRLLKGPGDGVSDSIPAVIGNKQPARLADGEFVIPARIVSELGNGSTEAGARKLYAMMERIQKQRGKTVGKGKVAVNSKASKHLPA